MFGVCVDSATCFAVMLGLIVLRLKCRCGFLLLVGGFRFVSCFAIACESLDDDLLCGYDCGLWAWICYFVGVVVR